ncbi:aminoacyl-histidine dipeptidase [Helicobacter enhydrae]|uniref:Aminoacyl-histidine dipeptidase n=1 Tax=Helicobacter enhydrae TaxID=222136 RepID=A0A1B1U6J6_9HELI|nr:M20/M25/M40 family metallo-hydrolase [Helicobacter enhydrae]ANV98413.1 aminoacyl-histidine dipeptidase [Helicobacter enhydrae]
MQEVIEYFEAICQIPHCSFDTQQMREFIVDFALENQCEVKVDSVGNIHAYKGNPTLCLQSHYDMVCMGEAPRVEMYEDEGYLKAKNSSLGADNGIGVAIMLVALKRFQNIECLFTNDEEVGLVGANGLEHRLIAKNLLNLDCENEEDVTISCAGGVDVFAQMPYGYQKKTGSLYEVEVVGLRGGHSGVDIVTNPTNAIKTLASFIAKNGGEIIEFNGGERINSIPKYAKAKVIFPHQMEEGKNIELRFLGVQEVDVCDHSQRLLQMINSFAHGLRSYDLTLGIVKTSINLAMVKMQDKMIRLELFARSNEADGLYQIEFETLEFFKAFGCMVQSDNFYLPWEAKESAFAHQVLDAMHVSIPTAKFYAIHAGLECGVIGAKQEGLECCSIGPNIYNPHSTSERCEIRSVEKIARVVFDLIGANENTIESQKSMN